ncbi:gluconokinase [Beijerinckia indica]|uniref:Gluconokinase n=1 Tax=Beijerinckia indica subsp. indica (strain ATCC 9039 / DSM 1715 / NCIMB 8712) TaxID=395963 RepID=B2IBI1_BEII9|nr:gluconokinase [Beijerinckia indica]ACB96607.1 carbohydrate kinase, thermoresistant glucokinase family [Beijerinckia indica subsp. indica ATCC 9039]
MIVSRQHPHAIIVMGVSGSGKSTLGTLLAQALHVPYLEGDDFHSAENKAKMASGHPLDDADRWPWLDHLGQTLGQEARAAGAAIASCSALKHAYRQRLAQAAQLPLQIVFLDGDPAILSQRMQARHHFMPASLLASQCATLEPPAPGEQALTLSIEEPPEKLVAQAVAWLQALDG